MKTEKEVLKIKTNANTKSPQKKKELNQCQNVRNCLICVNVCIVLDIS